MGDLVRATAIAVHRLFVVILLGLVSCNLGNAGETGSKTLNPKCRAALSKAGLDRQELWGENRLPHLTPEQKKQLIDEFVKDGRDILVFSDSWETAGTGLSTVMIVLKDEVARLTGGKVNIQYVTPQNLPKFKIKFQDETVARLSRAKFEEIVEEVNPQAAHIITERALGHQAAWNLRKAGIPYTTAYHTELPKYLALWAPTWAAKPVEWAATKILKYFHSKGMGVLVPTNTMVDNLLKAGYDPALPRYWSHGVDLEKFNTTKADPSLYAGLPRPISLFAGRIESEKNIEDFLQMKIPGTKVLLGEGSDKARLQAKYPDAVFLGAKPYSEVPVYMASANKFVFPSLLDTYGLVQTEAIASGLGVVAYRVQGPQDVVTSDSAGRLAEYDSDPSHHEQNIKNLEEAWFAADAITPEQARAFAEDHSWENTTLEFLHFLKRLRETGSAAH